MTKPRHPMQPIIIDPDGRARFNKNPIVRFLLDNGPFDLATISDMPFSQEDEEQFLQLIGYSVDGYGELSRVSERSKREAGRAAAVVEAVEKEPS